MDLPPTIPTSFVPQSAAAAARRFRPDYTGVFAYVGYGVFAVVFILALGVFFYGRILSATQASKDAALAKAEASIDPATVVGFVRLRDRLDSSVQLLAGHVAFSGFFALLETLQPTTVRLTSLHLILDDTKTAKFDGSGTAKSFNALAAASIAFATDGRIKDAIFSNISIGKDNTVSFTLSATLDPKLIAFTP